MPLVRGDRFLPCALYPKMQLNVHTVSTVQSYTANAHSISYLGKASFMSANAYASTAIAAAFSLSSTGTTLSSVSAAL